ncbi:MAG TPA: ATP-binding protein [Thermoanaerobaculia bacterium]
MPFRLQRWFTAIPVVAGSVLALASLWLVTTDALSVRADAEAEIVALAETTSGAVDSLASGEVDPYLQRLLKHPAIAMATVYSDADRTTRRRPHIAEPGVFGGFLTSFREAVVGCHAGPARTVCLEADPTYYGRRLSALLLPHLALLGASAILLGIAVALGRGSGRARLIELTSIVRGAADDSNLALRASEAPGPAAELAKAINRLLEQIQQRDIVLRRRTTELEGANRELESFSYSVSHDLRSPLASVDGFAQALAETQSERLDEEGREYLRWIQDAVEQMKNLVSGLLQMSRMSRAELNRARVDLSAVASSIADSLRQRDPSRSIEFNIQSGMFVDGDERLLHAVLENLMSNAYKFTGKKEHAVIRVGSRSLEGRPTYFVQDNGAGFDSTLAARMFTPFQRLHATSEFEGTGIGLATVRRIIERHGGTIWAEGKVGEGATFEFTLAETPARRERHESELTASR